MDQDSKLFLIDMEEYLRLSKLYLVELESFFSGLYKKNDEIVRRHNNGDWAETSVEKPFGGFPPAEAIEALNKIEDIEIFQDALRDSLFINLFTLIESELKRVCILQREKRSDISLSLSDIADKSEIDRCKKYLLKVLKSEFSFSNKEWSNIKNYQILRNCIIHHNGNISNLDKKRKEELIKFINDNSNLSLYKDFVFIERGFIEEVIKTIEDFFSNLLSSGYSK